MANLDAVFHCLSDATRRSVISQLCKGPARVSDLAARYDMALPSFLKHLKVLEAGGWIETRKVGRVRTCQLRNKTVQTAENWLSLQRKSWEARLDQLDALLANHATDGRTR